MPVKQEGLGQDLSGLLGKKTQVSWGAGDPVDPLESPTSTVWAGSQCLPALVTGYLSMFKAGSMQTLGKEKVSP